ncbi:MAG: LacI family DNA-binding transcriptional regulator [Ruminococcus sp.]|nr:LacI family DNA-binding transcriptional regulator [Ruminococcus sp.]
MATIKEIATLAGVSRGTVDRVLNHRGSVNPKTAEKILEIAHALDYKPNKAGIVLAAQKRKLKIGVVLLGAGNPFFDEVLLGVSEKASELAGYNCTVLTRQTDYSLEEQLLAIDELLEEGIDGLALTPYNDIAIRRKINELYERNIPVVTLNTDIENSRRIAYVGSNYYRSGQTAAGLLRLMTTGQVYVGIISGSRNVLCHTERIAGFQSVIDRYENIHISRIITNQDDDFESYEMTARLLKEHPEINALYFVAGGVYGGCRAVVASGRQYDIKMFAYDMVETTKKLVEQELIAATICQQPLLQGSRPLDILFAHLTTGESPQSEYNYIDLDIRIKENLS